MKLEQLERLRSQIPPAAPWLPILVIHIRSQVKISETQYMIIVSLDDTDPLVLVGTAVTPFTNMV